MSSWTHQQEVDNFKMNQMVVFGKQYTKEIHVSVKKDNGFSIHPVTLLLTDDAYEIIRKSRAFVMLTEKIDWIVPNMFGVEMVIFTSEKLGTAYTGLNIYKDGYQVMVQEKNFNDWWRSEKFEIKRSDKFEIK